MFWTFYWLAIAMALCGISQTYRQLTAASMGALCLFCGMSLMLARDQVQLPDARQASALEFASFVGSVADPTYHRTGCPLSTRGILFRTRDEAEWLNKVPCRQCLMETAAQAQPQYTPLPRKKAG